MNGACALEGALLGVHSTTLPADVNVDLAYVLPRRGL
jgi:hypothetical protein